MWYVIRSASLSDVLLALLSLAILLSFTGFYEIPDADDAAQKLALQLAQTWLESNHIGYLQNGGKMIEKYNGMAPGAMGGGGEYDVQVGFGWTNGVMLHFLQNYGWQPNLSLRDNIPKPVNPALIEPEQAG